MKIKPNKEQINFLIDFLYNTVAADGGDGDAIWHSRYFDLADIKPLVEEYNAKHNVGWEIKQNSLDYFSWGKGEESILITTDKNLIDTYPDWVLIKLYY